MNWEHALGWGLIGGAWAFVIMLFATEAAWWFFDRRVRRDPYDWQRDGECDNASRVRLLERRDE